MLLHGDQRHVAWEALCVWPADALPRPFSPPLCVHIAHAYKYVPPNVRQVAALLPPNVVCSVCFTGTVLPLSLNPAPIFTINPEDHEHYHEHLPDFQHQERDQEQRSITRRQLDRVLKLNNVKKAQEAIIRLRKQLRKPTYMQQFSNLLLPNDKMELLQQRRSLLAVLKHAVFMWHIPTVKAWHSGLSNILFYITFVLAAFHPLCGPVVRAV